MAMRSIPAPNDRPLTSEEAEEIARGILDELRKIVPRKRSLIADEAETDFLERVTGSLKSCSKPIEQPPQVPQPIPETVVDFGCVEGKPLFQVKHGTSSRARLQLALDLLGSANLTISSNNAEDTDLAWPCATLVEHALASAEALLRAELEK